MALKKKDKIYESKKDEPKETKWAISNIEEYKMESKPKEIKWTATKEEYIPKEIEWTIEKKKKSPK